MRALFALGLLVSADGALAMPPPPDSATFTPSVQQYSGPAPISFSGFCVTLDKGETATRNQYAAWASRTSLNLREGRLEIEENGSGVASKIGTELRKLNRGAILMDRVGESITYYFYDGMPGSTTISFVSDRGDQTIDPILNRFC